MNRARLITSGLLFVFSIYCLIFNPSLPFELPLWVYIVATIYFAIFPIKDMFSICNKTLYKGRQFGKNYQHSEDYDKLRFNEKIKDNNKKAIKSMMFWLVFVSVPAVLYFMSVIGREWIFFFFALSNFSVFYAIFGWCPFHRIFIKPECCLECRIYNWDSFFQYSFLILIPNVFTIILFSLGVLSLIEWELVNKRYPERFYKESNCSLTCENCDLEACKQHKKKLFSIKLKETK